MPDSAGSSPGWLERRREKVRAELERNRRGGHKVPTWALTVLLVGFVALWTTVILVFS